MPLALFRRARSDGNIATLYGAIVAQAREPAFYRDYGVPDTQDGRFDMIVLHLALVLRCLREADLGGSPLAQGLFDAFCKDMDHNLREQGLSDAAVPRRMRAFGEAFYGRAAAYDRALNAGDPVTLAATLARNMFGSEGARGAAALGRYVVAATATLDAADIAGGALPQFPSAEAGDPLDDQ